ncbi:MAG: type II toxin-antitoxin system prevent-host-death family antitoxin [Balneola sp.]
MKEIGSYDAKTNLPEILRKVEGGETFLITRRGKPVAELVPISESEESLKILYREMRLNRKERQPVNLSEIKDWKREGHKY